MYTPYQHQNRMALEALSILKEHGLVYLACEERTGKTLTAILAAEMTPAKKVLVITKKKALDGWWDALANYPVKKDWAVVNYHQAHKVDVSDTSLIILDESHNYISSYPKPGKIWKQLAPKCGAGRRLIYISATPYAQGAQMLYHQLKLSSFSPWVQFSNFYNWFRVYGKPYTKEINGIPIQQYDRAHTDKILADVEHLFITATREELGFDFEPVDKTHWIELEPTTKAVYNELLEHQLIELRAGTLVCDTKSKLRAALHMLEGGTAKIDDQRVVLANEEKIQYIKNTFGDSPELVIMYNFIAEREKLEKHFKHALLLQATSYAEGVDLHEYDTLVIYSQDYSTARHTQRRARQANKNRAKPITVHYLLVKKGISEQVYKTVSINKRNYVDSVFKKESI